MKPDETAEDPSDIGVFTEKQCRVLDLLIENKTSKEIARTLGISPYTVDQRISLARGRVGVASRNELAAHYRAMRKRTIGPTPHPVSRLDRPGSVPNWRSGGETARLIEVPKKQHDTAVAATNVAPQAEIACPTPDRLDYRVGPEVFEGRSGGLWKLGAIVATALFLVMMVLGLFAIFDQLNDMLA